MIKFRRCASNMCEAIIYPYHEAWKKKSKYCCEECRYGATTLNYTFLAEKKKKKLEEMKETEIVKEEVINDDIIGLSYPHKDSNVILVL